MRKTIPLRSQPLRASGALRRLSAVAVTALGCALAAHARADTCVAIDAARDGLSEPERHAARVLFEESLADEGVKVTTDGCTETFRLYHVRLGESVTVVASGPPGSARRRVSRVEDLPGAYSQLTRSLLRGEAATNDGGAIDRTNVTLDQTDPLRVRADNSWYVRLGYSAAAAGGGSGGPAFGFGRRWELDRFALDLSFLGFSLWQDGSDGDDAVSSEIIGLGAHYFFDPHANHSAYVGLGLGLGTQSLPGGLEGDGLHGKLSAGYELFRASTMRLFTQLDLTLPFYLARSEPFEGPADEAYAPMLALGVGLGWAP